MQFERTVIANVPVDQAWEVLGNQFHGVDQWARGIKVSRQLAASGPAGVSSRQCEVPSMGTITERVDTFDPVERTFSYQVVEGAPGMMRFLGNTWWIKPVGDRQTEISFRIRADLKPIPGFFMGWMMKRQMNGLCDQICEDLKTYLETGKPSALKVEEMAKLGVAAAAA